MTANKCIPLLNFSLTRAVNTLAEKATTSDTLYLRRELTENKRFYIERKSASTRQRDVWFQGVKLTWFLPDRSEAKMKNNSLVWK